MNELLTPNQLFHAFKVSIRACKRGEINYAVEAVEKEEASIKIFCAVLRLHRTRNILSVSLHIWVSSPSFHSIFATALATKSIPISQI